MPAGRFAPSPSGDLHVGNLRTAVLAWLFARASDRHFLVRVDDLDRVRHGAERRQLDDLLALGLTWDGDVVHQTGRAADHAAAIGALVEQGRTFECYCTRRDVLEAPTAPHLPPGAYPGTCRDLTDAERAVRRAEIAAEERSPALRLRADVTEWTVHDDLNGDYTGAVDDVVLRRGDGVVAYNLAVVVDDAAQDVDQVVRGDDLLTSAPRQAHLAHLLGLAEPQYVHVPLALNAEGRRLAKRDGAVTRRDLEDRGVDVLAMIAESLGLEPGPPAALLEQFDPARLPRDAWTVVPPA